MLPAGAMWSRQQKGKGSVLTKQLQPAKQPAKRSISFVDACARYVHRFTQDHVPRWALTPIEPGKYYAPQYRSDREWYELTRFPGEPGHLSIGDDCYSTGQTWPAGKWLDAPYVVE